MPVLPQFSASIWDALVGQDLRKRFFHVVAALSRGEMKESMKFGIFDILVLTLLAVFLKGNEAAENRGQVARTLTLFGG